MSSLDKVVKLACKPKPAPPKAKYLDPIIAATWSEDGAVYDVCKALVPRLREPNAIIVFKALIVLHTMIRNGATDNVLSHLSSSEVLRLRNVSAGNWEGYNAPQNMQHYALYLDSRIRAYRELKHDAIRVQAESNRDLRLNNSIEEDMAYTTVPPPKASSTKSKTPQRSKTIMGRKLRVMTVEKGLLRETRTVQDMIDSLVECRFYLDDLEDELTITALRMLVKDLLILFQALNEGVINVLEHYFEMSKYDAAVALGIYRHFCDQTERVVEYLGVAKKLQNLLNVPIPNLKHAPVSLASSLQDYLNDPNFEQNRMEYKASKGVTNGHPRDRDGAPPVQASRGPSVTSTNPVTTEASVKPPPPPSSANGKLDVSPVIADFFSSIEEEQSANNQSLQMAAHNPFVQRQMTGAFPAQSFGGQIQMHSTGFPPSLPSQFAQPFQPTQMLPLSQVNSFTIEAQQTSQHRPFSTFVPQQVTGVQYGATARFLQPQPTGANPFRQSLLVPQAIAPPPYDNNGPIPMPPSPVPQAGFFLGNAESQPPIVQLAKVRQLDEVLPRPASTPLTSIIPNSSSASPPAAQPVKSHQTGSRNPFGIPVTPAPPVPKPPTLLELTMGFGGLSVDDSQRLAQSIADKGQQGQSDTATESIFSTVASSFAFTSKLEENPSSTNDMNRFGSHSLNFQLASPHTSLNPSDSFPSSISSTQPSSSVSSQAPMIPVTSPIKMQNTGFGGVKPFKPTSSFGASLLESLPPIPQSGTAIPDPGAHMATHSSAASLPADLVINGSVQASGVGKDGNAPGAGNSQPAGVPHPLQRMNGGSTPGVGLRPQVTGALGAANPFRATMFTTASSGVKGSSNAVVSSASMPPFGGLSSMTGPLPVFGPGFGHGTFGPPFAYLSQDNANTQQQNAGVSLT